jgi:hypothetical protein
MLIAAGLFALYLTLGEATSEPLRPRVTRLGLALVAIVAGFGMGMPQILPFLEYIPHSPRAGGYSVGYAGSTSYGIPWSHVPELFLAGFTGDSAAGTYWASNPLKLHSEYLGLPVIALAILGFGDRRRRLVWWMSGIGLLFLLISLGGATPFYHLWWLVMPYVKKTRAPGMVFFVVALCVSMFAALGATRLERGEGRVWRVRVWLIAAGVVALLGVIGVFGQMAVSLAPDQRVGAAIAHGDEIRRSALIGALFLATVALLVWGRLQGRVPAAAFALGLPLLVGLDLWRDGRHFWQYSPPPHEGLYRADAVVTRLKAAPRPLRVLDVNVYPQNVLMAHGIPQVLGYQGNELRYYDDLLGGRNEWRYLSSTRLWSLLGVRYVLIPDTTAIPGYHLVEGPVSTAAGNRAYVYEADTLPPYARVIPAAVKVENDSAIPPTLADPRLPGYDHAVLLPSNAPINPPALTALPPPSPSKARVTAWDAGKMTVELDPAPRESSYVMIAENWYVDWRARVDGQAALVLRGDNSLLTIPVAPGARKIELDYHSRTYARGKLIAGVTLVIVLAGFVVPPLAARRRGGGSG